MRNRLPLVIVGLVLLSVPLVLAASVQKPAGAAPKDFLQVGQSYVFLPPPGYMDRAGGEVLERHGETWVKVRFPLRDQEFSDEWINLAHIKSIRSYRPAGEKKK